MGAQCFCWHMQCHISGTNFPLPRQSPKGTVRVTSSNITYSYLRSKITILTKVNAALVASSFLLLTALTVALAMEADIFSTMFYCPIQHKHWRTQAVTHRASELEQATDSITSTTIGQFCDRHLSEPINIALTAIPTGGGIGRLCCEIIIRGLRTI